MSEMASVFRGAQKAIKALDQSIQDLTTYREQAAILIAQYLRVQSGVELDPDAIRATLTHPYTLLPINDGEAWLIHWAGIKMPVFGQIVAREPAFIKSRITRTMNLITPFPSWILDEAGWKPPEHQASINSLRNAIEVVGGDEATFKRRYGQFLGANRGGGTYAIKGGDAWIRLVAALVHDGILPYKPMPVDQAHWNLNTEIPEELTTIIDQLETKAGSPYIHRAVDEFLQRGAVLVNYPPGAGKTLVGCLLLNHFQGDVLILVDSTFLEGHWRNRIKQWAPHASNVVVSTYQGAGKYAKKKWDLIIPDEAQRFPANTFSKLAFIETLYRCGLTGTPWREDNRQHLIVALCGFPITITWSELMALGVLQTPRIIVATVASLEAKTGYVKSLLSKQKGRGLIYCDWLEQGQALANALNVPFIQGATRRKMEVLQENEVVVVSRVGDRGLDVPDLRFVIEVAGHGAAKEQYAQRLGRLLHSQFKGTFYTVFTRDELQKYRARLWGVEAEMGGAVEIEFVEIGNVPTEVRAPRVAKPRSAPVRPTPKPEKPKDEIARVMELPAVSAKIEQTKKSLGQDSAPFVVRVLRYCWDTALSPREIMEGLGLTGVNAFSRINAACKAALKMDLMTVNDQEQYRVNREEIDRLSTLSKLKTGG